MVDVTTLRADQADRIDAALSAALKRGYRFNIGYEQRTGLRGPIGAERPVVRVGRGGYQISKCFGSSPLDALSQALQGLER